MHIRLLHSVFDSIEADVRLWRRFVVLLISGRSDLSLVLSSDPIRSITDALNHTDNQIFCVNVVHIISQMADILCNSCGGLLPLLASATSASVGNEDLLCLSRCLSSVLLARDRSLGEHRRSSRVECSEDSQACHGSIRSIYPGKWKQLLRARTREKHAQWRHSPSMPSFK